MKRVRLGAIYAHALTCAQVLDEVTKLVVSGEGGYIVTPNVDHVVQAEHDEALREAYAEASLSLVDGQPLIWLSKLMGESFPEKISGSDFVPQLVRVAAMKTMAVVLPRRGRGRRREGRRGVAAPVSECTHRRPIRRRLVSTRIQSKVQTFFASSAKPTRRSWCSPWVAPSKSC